MINYKKLTVALICGTILTFPIAGCGLTAQTTENTAATTQQGITLTSSQSVADTSGLTLEFDEDGNLQFKTEALEADARFDEIGSALKIKELQRDKKELLESLEMYYKVFFLGDIPDEELQKKADAVEE